MTKSRAQLEEELRMNEILKAERACSDDRYAMKIFEKIAIYVLYVILGAVVGAWIKLTLK